jgi:hypothetical protein
MKQWIQNFSNEDKKNESLLKLFQEFFHTDSETARIAPALKHATESTLASIYSIKDSQQLNSSSEAQIDIFSIPSAEIAKQMILLDHHAFLSLDIGECLKKRFETKESGPTFAVLINRSNHVSLTCQNLTDQNVVGKIDCDRNIKERKCDSKM